MPDIAMCPGEGCDVRNECYRHRALPNGDSQAWMVTPDNPGRECGSFEEIWPRGGNLGPPTLGDSRKREGGQA